MQGGRIRDHKLQSLYRMEVHWLTASQEKQTELEKSILLHLRQARSFTYLYYSRFGAMANHFTIFIPTLQDFLRHGVNFLVQFPLLSNKSRLFVWQEW